MSRILILSLVGFVVGTEIEGVYGSATAIAIVAGAITVFAFSVVNNTKNGECVMAAADDESVEINGPLGISGKVRGARVVSDNLVLVVMIIALGVFIWHDAKSEEKMSKLFDAIAENTYVLSLNQVDRERLQIVMPDSLKRKIRAQQTYQYPP